MSGQPLFRQFRRLLAMIALLSASAVAVADDRQYTAVAPDGVTLAIQESGDPAGPAIVFVHGLLGSRLSWRRSCPAPVAALSPDRLRPARPRPVGQTDRAAGLHRWPALADDLAAVIAASGARQPVLVGWSLGAAVTTNYGRVRRRRCRRRGLRGRRDRTGRQPDRAASRGVSRHGVDRPEDALDAERAFLALCFETQPDRATFERLLANAALASPGCRPRCRG